MCQYFLHCPGNITSWCLQTLSAIGSPLSAVDFVTALLQIQRTVIKNTQLELGRQRVGRIMIFNGDVLKYGP